MPVWTTYIFVCDVCTREERASLIPAGWIVNLAFKPTVTCPECRIKAKEKELKELKESIANE